MDYVALAIGLALPWFLGLSLLLALGWPRARPAWPSDRGGIAAWRLGCGYFVGTLLLTLWMRALSMAGIRFGWIAIGVPMLLVTAACFAVAARGGRLQVTAVRAAAAAFTRPALPRLHAWVWQLLVVLLMLRFALLATEVAWQPLYPWDAWVQWATKARVWYELGHMASFVDADGWLARTSDAYFDAAPHYPATLPLLQVWSCIAFGRWDDSAMNWPWLLTLIALTLGVYGAVRDSGLPPLGALVGAYLVASLPLLEVHVALAGYADLMMAAVYTLAALALYRWTLGRDPRDAAIALLLGLACPMIAPTGVVWALTLVPAVLVALLPEHGMKLVAATLGVAALAVLALTQSDMTILGHRLHLEFQAPWQSLIDSDLLFANWHLLWYCLVALALLGAPRLVRAPLAPLAMVLAWGLALVFFASAYPDAVARTVGVTPLNRATLQLAPLLVCAGVLLWREMTTKPDGAAREASVTPASAAADA